MSRYAACRPRRDDARMARFTDACLLATARPCSGGSAPMRLIADQLEPAAALLAEHLGLPFASVASALPINREPGIPPPYVGWRHDPSDRGVKRNIGRLARHRPADAQCRPGDRAQCAAARTCRRGAGSRIACRRRCSSRRRCQADRFPARGAARHLSLLSGRSERGEPAAVRAAAGRTSRRSSIARWARCRARGPVSSARSRRPAPTSTCACSSPIAGGCRRAQVARLPGHPLVLRLGAAGGGAATGRPGRLPRRHQHGAGAAALRAADGR